MAAPPAAEPRYNVVTEFPSPGLHSAAATGNHEYALAPGQPVDSGLDGVLPLDATGAESNESVAKVLIERAADVDTPRLPRRYSDNNNPDTSAPIIGMSGSTLHSTAASGNTNIDSTLLPRGTDTNRESTMPVDVSSVGNFPLPLSLMPTSSSDSSVKGPRDVLPDPDIDPQILEALMSKDRIFVLKLGEHMEALINDSTLTRRQIDFSPATTYQRMLVHRCCAYYGLSPETDPVTRAITASTTTDSRIPPRRLTDLAPPITEAPPKFRIMMRTPVAGDDADESDIEEDMSDTGSLGRTGFTSTRKAVEERTAAYNEARNRIFAGFEENGPGDSSDIGRVSPPLRDAVGPRLRWSTEIGARVGMWRRVSGAHNPSRRDDDVLSVATSSATSSSSRGTSSSTSYTSATSYKSTSAQHHPLPARPDWAVGLKLGTSATLNAPRRDHGQGHHSLGNSTTTSRTVPRATSAHSLHQNQEQESPALGHVQPTPPALTFRDFPPLTTSTVTTPEKPRLAGAWTNSITTDGPNLMRNDPPRDAAHDENKTGTFVIYSPDEIPEVKDGFPSTSRLTSDLGIGGCSISVHEPVAAVAWIENNWDHSLLSSFQNNNCDGPLPMMLFPTQPALALFGSYHDPFVTDAAQSLAKLSGFPVVIRPSSDNPIRTLLASDCSRSISPQASEHNGTAPGNTEPSEHNGNVTEGSMLRNEGMHGEVRGNRQRDNESSDEDELDPEDHRDRAPDRDEVHNEGKNGGAGSGHGVGSGGDGDDGGGGPGATDHKWESELHRTRLKLHLKLNNAHSYAIAIGYNFKFKINGEPDLPIDFENLTRPLSQPEVIALVDFEIETRPRETQVDRSYANIGFVAHRKESIMQRKFLHRGYDLPDQIFKRGQQQQIQRGLTTTLGFSSGPLATAAFSYQKNRNVSLEATDSKIMPRCRVDYETGDELNQDSKSYTSYNIAYQRQDMRLDAEPGYLDPLEVKVGIGINLRPSGSEQPLPKISFVNRNQVLFWVSDPTSRARVRGIVVLMSSYLENIRAEEKLSVYEEEDVDLMDTEISTPRQTKTDTNKPGTISLSIAKVQRQDTPNSIRFITAVPNMIARLGQRPRTPAVDIPPQEYLARGWDATNNQWRNVLWPALDQHFRAADLERTSPVWNIKWKMAQTKSGEENSTRRRGHERRGKGKGKQETSITTVIST